jgi:anti-sigma B factor antagonist
MHNLELNSERHGDITLIKLAGSLDTVTASDFSNLLKQEIAQGSRKFVCNLEELEYIASAGLGVFISINESLRNENGEIRISAINKKIYNILQILGFIDFFVVCDNDEKAMKSFQ